MRAEKERREEALWTFRNYRTYLAQWVFPGDSAPNASRLHRALALRGFGPSRATFLRMLKEPDAHRQDTLRAEDVAALVAVLDLNAPESTLFGLLVQALEGATMEERWEATMMAHLQSRQMAHAQSSIRVPSTKHGLLFGHVLSPIVREALVAAGPVGLDLGDLVRSLGHDADAIRLALEDLARGKYLIREGDRWVATNTEDQVDSPLLQPGSRFALRSYWRDLLLRARDAIDLVKSEEREFANCTFSMCPSLLDEARAEVGSFMLLVNEMERRSMARAEAGERREIYQLTVMLWPATQERSP